MDLHILSIEYALKCSSTSSVIKIPLINTDHLSTQTTSICSLVLVSFFNRVVYENYNLSVHVFDCLFQYVHNGVRWFDSGWVTFSVGLCSTSDLCEQLKTQSASCCLCTECRTSTSTLVYAQTFQQNWRICNYLFVGSEILNTMYEKALGIFTRPILKIQK